MFQSMTSWRIHISRNVSKQVKACKKWPKMSKIAGFLPAIMTNLPAIRFAVKFPARPSGQNPFSIWTQNVPKEAIENWFI